MLSKERKERLIRGMLKIIIDNQLSIEQAKEVLKVGNEETSQRYHDVINQIAVLFLREKVTVAEEKEVMNGCNQYLEGKMKLGAGGCQGCAS